MAKREKRAFISLFCATLMILPMLFFNVVVSAEDHAPLLIYTAHDYEQQNVGDEPYGVSAFRNSTGAISVVNAETDDISSNKAMHIGYHAEKPYARYFLSHAPISKDFVLSFDLKQTDVSKSKIIKVETDALLSKCTYYHDYYSGNGFQITIGSDLRIYNTSLSAGFENGVWHSVAFAFDMNSDANDTVKVYVDGKSCGTVALPDMVNVCEIVFRDVAEGADYLIDNFKVYESENVVSESEFADEFQNWKSSPLCPDEKYEQGRLFQYDKFVYRAIYDRTVGMIDAKKIWKENQLYSIKPIISRDGYLLAPVGDLVELFGADIEWNDEQKSATLTKDDKVLIIRANSDIYHSNGKPAKLKKPVCFENEELYMSLDILSKFLGFDCKINEDLIYFGNEILLDHDLGPMTVNGQGRTLEEEVIEGIRHFLLYDRPTDEEILELFRDEENSIKKPTLLVDNFDWIGEGISRDEEFESVWNSVVINSADIYLAEGVLDVPTELGTIAAAKRCSTLALAYRGTNNEDYLELAWNQFKEIDEHGTLYNTQFLDIGESAFELGKMYAWLRDTDPQMEVALREFIYNNVLIPFEQGYISSSYAAKTAYAQDGGNQSIIINCAGIACAIALMDSYPEICSEIVSCGIRSVERSLDGFGPDGAWEEGYSYWLYTCSYLPFLIDEIEHSCGSDFGLSDAPGLLKTIYYAIAQKGATGGYAVGDATPQGFSHGMFMWHAKKTNDKRIAAFRKNYFGHKSTIDLFNWVFDTDDADFSLEDIGYDIYLRGTEEVSLRTGWSNNDTSVLFHGGGNDDGHGHIDIGTFQFDMLGERWATEVPKATYGISSGSEDTNRPHYRNAGEGHNMVIANVRSDDNPYGMEKSAQGTITDYSFGNNVSYAVMDLTQSNSLYSCGRRGVMLDKTKNEVIVQDNFKSKEATEFWWFMHLQDTEVIISDDGKTAILTKNGVSVTASIISTSDAKFTLLEAKYLAEQLEGYDYVTPSNQESNEGYQKLAIKQENTDLFNITVVFKPTDYVSNTSIVLPMERWKSLRK